MYRYKWNVSTKENDPSLGHHLVKGAPYAFEINNL